MAPAPCAAGEGCRAYGRGPRFAAGEDCRSQSRGFRANRAILSGRGVRVSFTIMPKGRP
jgi:hypothetical protein